MNDWRVLDEKTHTDVIERIVETPKKTIYIDEFVEIEKNVKITEDSENITNERTNTSKRKDITTNIYDEVDDVKREKLTSSDSRIVRRTTTIFACIWEMDLKYLYSSVESIKRKHLGQSILKCAFAKSVLVGK